MILKATERMNGHSTMNETLIVVSLKAVRNISSLLQG